MILSTHIVDDVTDLCPRMAIIVGGRIVREGVPHELIAGLAGRIWRRTIERSEVEAFRAGHEVISTRLREGRTVVHVVADASPGAGFERRRRHAGRRVLRDPGRAAPPPRAAAAAA